MIANVKTNLPGPNSEKYLKISKEFEPDCMSRQIPIVLASGEGVTLTDVDGNKFIDFTSGVLVANVGHCHPKHVDAIQKATSQLMNCYDIPTPNRVNLARRLVEKSPINLDKAFLLTTGSETTEASIRISKRYTGKHEIISFFGGFHGRTYGAMSACGIMRIKNNYGPMLPGAIYIPYAYCYRCPFGKKVEDCNLFCADYIDIALKGQSTGDIAALIIEPYQGTAGFIFPPEGYLKKIENWCKKNNIIFILDEVQSSFGRTGKFFAAEWENLNPNIMCIGKGIGSGIPTSALLSESRIISSLESGDMSSTTGGNPVSCAAALSVIEIMDEEKLPDNAAAIGKLLKESLEKMALNSIYLGDVRGKGLAIGLEFVEDKKNKIPSNKKAFEFIKSCAQKGLLLGIVGIYGNVVRVAPPLVIKEQEALEALSIIKKSLMEIC